MAAYSQHGLYQQCSKDAHIGHKQPCSFPEKNVKFVQEAKVEVIYTKDDNEGNEINVLPTCDTLHLARNNIPFGEASSLGTEKGFQEKSNKEKHNNQEDTENEENAPKERDETISSLEAAVEKVVEFYVTGHTPNHGKGFTSFEETLDDNSTRNDTALELPALTADTVGDVEQSEEAAEVVSERSSPSQSESSRATRWEALADIAAELPPSLAVDPITGQIYALSK